MYLIQKGIIIYDHGIVQTKLTCVELFDIQGRKLAEYPNLTEILQMNVNHLNNGIYLLKLYSENNITVTKRLVVIK